MLIKNKVLDGSWFGHTSMNKNVVDIEALHCVEVFFNFKGFLHISFTKTLLEKKRLLKDCLEKQK